MIKVLKNNARRNLCKTLVLVMVLVSVLVCFQVIVVHAASEDLTAIADTFIEIGVPDNNNGDGVFMKARYTLNGAYSRMSYIKFDISGLSNVESVTLKLYAIAFTDGKETNSILGVYGVPNNNWEEDVITANNNLDTAGRELLAQMDFTAETAINTWYEFDVTAFVKSQLAANKTEVTIMLDNLAKEGVNPQGHSDWETKEASNAPTLTVTSSVSNPVTADVSVVPYLLISGAAVFGIGFLKKKVK